MLQIQYVQDDILPRCMNLSNEVCISDLPDFCHTFRGKPTPWNVLTIISSLLVAIIQMDPVGWPWLVLLGFSSPGIGKKANKVLLRIISLSFLSLWVNLKKCTYTCISFVKYVWQRYFKHEDTWLIAQLDGLCYWYLDFCVDHPR